MVGGFPTKRAAAPVSTVADDVEFDEDGRILVTAPIVPAANRPPATFARSLPPMPSAPRPGGLPPRPVAPVKPAPRVGPLAAPKAATPTVAVKRPPPAPYVRRPPVTHLDPNDVPPGSYSANWGKR